MGDQTPSRIITEEKNKARYGAIAVSSGTHAHHPTFTLHSSATSVNRRPTCWAHSRVWGPAVVWFCWCGLYAVLALLFPRRIGIRTSRLVTGRVDWRTIFRRRRGPTWAKGLLPQFASPCSRDCHPRSGRAAGRRLLILTAMVLHQKGPSRAIVSLARGLASTRLLAGFRGKSRKDAAPKKTHRWAADRCGLEGGIFRRRRPSKALRAPTARARGLQHHVSFAGGLSGPLAFGIGIGAVYRRKVNWAMDSGQGLPFKVSHHRKTSDRRPTPRAASAGQIYIESRLHRAVSLCHAGHARRAGRLHDWARAHPHRAGVLPRCECSSRGHQSRSAIEMIYSSLNRGGS